MKKILPPHLEDEEIELENATFIPAKQKSISRQGPSKYGPGGRRVAKAKGRK